MMCLPSDWPNAWDVPSAFETQFTGLREVYRWDHREKQIVRTHWMTPEEQAKEWEDPLGRIAKIFEMSGAKMTYFPTSRVTGGVIGS